MLSVAMNDTQTTSMMIPLINASDVMCVYMFKNRNNAVSRKLADSFINAHMNKVGGAQFSGDLLRKILGF